MLVVNDGSVKVFRGVKVAIWQPMTRGGEIFILSICWLSFIV
jgi:hypothetical protein